MPREMSLIRESIAQYFGGGCVDDVDERDVESQHAENVGNAEEEENGIFHQRKIHKTGNLFSCRFWYAKAASTGFLVSGLAAGLYGFRDRYNTLAVGT